VFSTRPSFSPLHVPDVLMYSAASPPSSLLSLFSGLYPSLFFYGRRSLFSYLVFFVRSADSSALNNRGRGHLPIFSQCFLSGWKVSTDCEITRVPVIRPCAENSAFTSYGRYSVSAPPPSHSFWCVFRLSNIGSRCIL